MLRRGSGNCFGILAFGGLRGLPAPVAPPAKRPDRGKRAEVRRTDRTSGKIVGCARSEAARRGGRQSQRARPRHPRPALATGFP
ncbi:hypothetical protein BSIN_2609 [Burkholderia singularis]|uniref:Uncharacterized protein n=1 Tax=Burkholderia singularis TaxID=1503053 RepID=A0A238HCC3_9BURK|nr:hypothetical protein BSIN_2609 [Burkholderia singularis]